MCFFTELPTEPRNLAITNIQSSSVLLQFVPGFDGYTSISKWVVEAQTEAHRQARSEDAGWHVVFEVPVHISNPSSHV